MNRRGVGSCAQCCARLKPPNLAGRTAKSNLPLRLVFDIKPTFGEKIFRKSIVDLSIRNSIGRRLITVQREVLRDG